MQQVVNVQQPIIKPRRFKVYQHRQLDKIEALNKVPADMRFEMKVVANVLPFRVNEYVFNELIDWENVPNDPLFQLTFPQKDMLEPSAFQRMADLMSGKHTTNEVFDLATQLREEMNPHPAGQMQMNVPHVDGEPLPGMQHKYRETRRDERPQPRAQTAAPERRFVDCQVRLIRKNPGEFVVDRFEGHCRFGFQRADVPGTARHVTNITGKQRGLASADAKPRRHQNQNRCQHHSGAAIDRIGKRSAGCDTATAARQSMLLVLGDEGANLNIPNLLPQRLLVASAKRLAAAAALVRFTGDDFFAIGGRDQRPFKLLMSALSALFAFRLRLFLGQRLGMRMFARGRFGRIAGVLRQFRFELLDAFFQLGDTKQQHLDKRPYRRRHLVKQFRRNLGHPSHAQGVADFPICEKTNSTGCERLRLSSANLTHSTPSVGL